MSSQAPRQPKAPRSKWRALAERHAGVRALEPTARLGQAAALLAKALTSSHRANENTAPNTDEVRP